MTFGQRVAQFRKERDWTQELLASKVGVHVRHVSRWETGRNVPHPKMKHRLAEIFEVPVETLTPKEEPSSLAELFHDEELVEEIQMLRELDPIDRATVRQVIKAFTTKRRMSQLISA